MTSRSGVLLGSRKPTHLSLPPATDNGRRGAECTELAASAGLHLDGWQQDVVAGGLAEVDGRCASPTVVIVLPRQNGKDAVLEAVELDWLFLDPNIRLITHTAHRFDTCLEHFLRLRLLIEETPDLSRKVRKISDTNGKEAIHLKDGCRILFKTRGSKGAGRGFTGDRIIFNEAMKGLSDLGSMVPSLSARPDPQLWFAGSAPLPGRDSDELRDLIRLGRDGDPTMAYFEWCAQHGVDFDDAKAIAEANPGLGIRLGLDWIQKVERKRLSDEKFGRERLGVYDEHQDGEPPKIEARHWKLCRTKLRTEKDAKRAKKWMRNPVAFGLAVTPDRDWSTIGAAGQCREGGTAIEVVEHRAGTDWVVDRMARLLTKHKRNIGVAIDPRGPAGSLIDPLRKAGCEVIECNTTDHAKACAQFFDGVRVHELVHRSTPELDGAVAVATARPMGDAWLFDRRHDEVPISPLESVELAAWAHHTIEPVDMASQVT